MVDLWDCGIDWNSIIIEGSLGFLGELGNQNIPAKREGIDPWGREDYDPS